MSKPFAWSYSRLKNFESCASRYHHLDILKDVKEQGSEHLDWGSLVHEAAARYLGKGIEMPPGMPRLQAWCERVKKTRETLGGKLLVEQKLAITETLKPCAYFDSDVWYRAVIDVLVVAAPVALLVDWKTGKRLEELGAAGARGRRGVRAFPARAEAAHRLHLAEGGRRRQEHRELRPR